MPAEDMSAEGHLRGNELFVETDTAAQKFFGPKDDIFDFFPFCSFVKLQITDLFVSSMGGIDYTT
jgi:hypothetical protein